MTSRSALFFLKENSTCYTGTSKMKNYAIYSTVLQSCIPTDLKFHSFNSAKTSHRDLPIYYWLIFFMSYEYAGQSSPNLNFGAQQNLHELVSPVSCICIYVNESQWNKKCSVTSPFYPLSSNLLASFW